MLPEAQLIHCAPGRLRIRIRSKKGDILYFASLQEKLAGFPSVQEVKVNPLTGSVLIRHGLEITPAGAKAMVDATELGGLVRLSVTNTDRVPASKTIANAFNNIDHQIKRFTDKDLDLPTVAAVGLTGFGLFQISKGDVATPAWYVALWYALNIFTKAHSTAQTAETS